jgi:hypothetical protein
MPQQEGQGAQQQVPQDGGGQQDGNANGQGRNGNGQDGGAQAPLAYNNAAQFLAAWNINPSNQACDNLEQEAIRLVIISNRKQSIAPLLRTCSLLP